MANRGKALEMVYRSPMVFTGRRSSFTAAAVTTTATREAGTFWNSLGQKISTARARPPTPTAAGFTVEKVRTTSSSFSIVSTGAFTKVRPKKSFSWPMRMVTAMPAVKPVVMV